MQPTPSKLHELRYLNWHDGPPKELAKLKKACPRLVINPRSHYMYSTEKMPEEAYVWQPLDGNSVGQVSQAHWRCQEEDATGENSLR